MTLAGIGPAGPGIVRSETGSSGGPPANGLSGEALLFVEPRKFSVFKKRQRFAGTDPKICFAVFEEADNPAAVQPRCIALIEDLETNAIETHQAIERSQP